MHIVEPGNLLHGYIDPAFKDCGTRGLIRRPWYLGIQMSYALPFGEPQLHYLHHAPHDQADRYCTRNLSLRDGTTTPKRPPWIIWRGRLQGRCETHRHLPATNGRTHKFQLLPPNIPGCVRDPRRRTRQLIPAACPWIQPKSPYPKAPKAPLLNQGGFSLFSNAT